MLIAELATICHGHWHGQVNEQLPVRLSTDSRKLKTGDVFLALCGEHFDAHDLLDQVGNAAAIIGEARGLTMAANTAYLEVANSLQALANIAHAHRLQQPAKVIAISGSCGKTTVRSMLAHAFRQLGVRVCETRANDNNLIGVPQTLLSIPAEAEVVLIECGISEQGEMQQLANMVEPDQVVLTCLSQAHAEGLGSLADIAKEKYRLVQGMRQQGQAFLGRHVAAQLPSDARSYRFEDGVDVMLNDDGHCVLNWQQQQTIVALPLPAEHWADNIALCANVLLHSGFNDLSSIGQALSNWQPVRQRLQMQRNRQGVRILDDAYNANPASMQAALNTLVRMDGQRIAILGDMAELGINASKLHASLDVHDLDQLFLIGSHMQHLAQRHPFALHYHSVDQWLATYHQHWQAEADDVVLIKASRSMHFERIVNELMQPSQRQELKHAV